MKYTTLFTTLLLSFQAFADAGGCVVYKATYVLKNGQSITGLLPLSGYEDYAYLDEKTQSNKYCNDKAFQTLINTAIFQHQHKRTFELYKGLYLVRYGKSSIQANNPNPFRCVFTDSSSVIPLHLDSIKYTLFLGAETAGWDQPDVGIVLVDSKTSRMMQQNEVFNYAGLYHDPEPEYPGSSYDYMFDGYLVLNFNTSLALSELKAEIERMHPQIYAPELKYLHSASKDREQVLQEERKQVIAPIISMYWEKGIVLIPVNDVD